MEAQAVIFSAPSGSGKTTIIRKLMERLPGRLGFSISATNRAPRGAEKNGVDYHFLTTEEFRKRIDAEAFLEFEEVYKGTYYGTLKSEVARLHNEGKAVLFDIDVVGGANLKKMFGNKACSFFIMAPSRADLEARLRGRGTESEEQIQKRLSKADWEFEYRAKFDHVIVNDDLDRAVAEVESILLNFLEA